jgi:Beta protein
MPKREIIYVPILKSKAGERWALSHLTPERKTKIRPLIELHAPRKGKGLGEHLESVCESFQAAWGVDRRFYFDTIWLNGGSGSPATIADVFEAAQECDLQAVPVVRPTYDDSSLEQLLAIVSENERGCLLRITPQTLNTPAVIDSVLEALELSPDDVDLVLDYRQNSMTLTVDQQKIPHLADWRLFIAASGVFPVSLASLPLHQWHEIPRHDWSSWHNAVEAGLERRPTYSDYTMRPPGAPAEFGEPSVNLRYALEDHWLVQVGGKHKDGAAPEIHAMSGELIAKPEYSGVDFSSGDEEIDRIAGEPDETGGPTQWLQWCVSHHIEFVVQQLSHAAA